MGTFVGCQLCVLYGLCPLLYSYPFFTIIIDYVAGIMIENAEGRKRWLFLMMSIFANVGVLGFFKYFNFFFGECK
jgi:D-alanyl-lipoteichoic acid acyltransferase DltB (MBOAT superfamily)